MKPATFIKSQRSGFTLIELLAVVAILLLLLSILLPGLQHAKEVSLDARCKSNLRQLVSMAANFAQDHNGVVPSGRSRTPEVSNVNDPLQACFMGNEVLVGTSYENQRLPSWPSGWPIGNSVAKPTWGTLFPYMGSDAALAKKLYRCIAEPFTALQSSQDSNGFFDYSVIKIFMLATIGNIPTSALMEYPEKSKIYVKKPTPWIMEENGGTINSKGYIEPGAASVDKMGSWHYGHGNYGALDGSVSSVSRFPGKTYAPAPEAFYLKYPSGVVMPGAPNGTSGPITGGNAANELWNEF